LLAGLPTADFRRVRADARPKHHVIPGGRRDADCVHHAIVLMISHLMPDLLP
jgi:hypothetical protein